MMGNSAADCAAALAEAGCAAIGVNCGDLDPSEVAEIVSVYSAAVDLPIMAEPNAGKPKLIEGETVFDMSPEEFAEGIKSCIGSGARIVGGCCGTTPAHIRAIARDQG